MITPDQKEEREHRVAIMMVDGKQTQEAAEAFCDTMPWLFGSRDKAETQERLI
jgi:transposase